MNQQVFSTIINNLGILVQKLQSWDLIASDWAFFREYISIVENIIEWKINDEVLLKLKRDSNALPIGINIIKEKTKTYLNLIRKHVDKNQFNTNLLCVIEQFDPFLSPEVHYFKDCREVSVEFLLLRGPHILAKYYVGRKIHKEDSNYNKELKSKLEIQIGCFEQREFIKIDNCTLSKDFWRRQTLKREMPDLALLIDILLHLTVTNALVESSFSIQKHIQRDTRERMSMKHIIEEMKIKWSQILEDRALKERKKDERKIEIEVERDSTAGSKKKKL